MLLTAYLWSSAFLFFVFACVWARKNWMNFFIKFVLFIAAIAGFVLLAGTR